MGTHEDLIRQLSLALIWWGKGDEKENKMRYHLLLKLVSEFKKWPLCSLNDLVRAIELVTGSPNNGKWRKFVTLDELRHIMVKGEGVNLEEYFIINLSFPGEKENVCYDKGLLSSLMELLTYPALFKEGSVKTPPIKMTLLLSFLGSELLTFFSYGIHGGLTLTDPVNRRRPGKLGAIGRRPQLHGQIWFSEGVVY